MRRRLLTLILALAAALAVAPSASASPDQLALFQDDGELLNRGDAVRDARLDELVGLGVDAVKIQLPWAGVAPGGARKPRGFQGQDLADYPDARFARFDGLLRAADARRLRVLVALSPPAPGWATPVRDGTEGVYRPNPREFGRFARAVGTRYDGTRRDAAGHPLPRVDLWTLWNEPNHPLFLLPLATRGGQPVAPHLYRELVRAAVLGLRQSGHGSADTILFGELLPIARGRLGPRTTIRPVTFLRDFFCLDSAGRALRGSAARSRGCARVREVTGVDGFAHHPYTRPTGPRTPEPSAEDATIRSLGRVTRTLDQAARAGRLARRGLPVWNTEFAYQSRPPDPMQAPLARIPGYLAEAEWIAYRNRRVASWSQYGLVDDALRLGPRSERYRGFQSGLRFADGRPKPGVYDAYRLPIHVRRLNRSTVEVWGAVRHARPGERVQVQAQAANGTWNTLPGGDLRVVNRRGYLRLRARPSRPTRRYRLLLTRDGSALTSRAATEVTP